MATVEIPEAEYQSLRETVTVLEQRVAILENRLDANGGHLSPCPDISSFRKEIVRITKELFPGDVTIRTSVDPEFPREPFHVVHASASGEIKAIEDSRIEWHKRLRELSPDLGVLPLRIAIRK